MKKNKLVLLFLLLLTVLTSCSIFGSRNKKWYQGDWADFAKHHWSQYEVSLRNIGIELKKPSRLSTYFITAEGTLGSGADRMPYVTREGQKLGGWWIGGCSSGASSYMAREAGGFWNPKVAQHELGHHAEHHALCHGGHPDYMRRAGAHHWPYWIQGRSFNTFNAEFVQLNIDGQTVCMFMLYDEDDISIRSFETEEQIKKRNVTLARDLIKLNQRQDF